MFNTLKNVKETSSIVENYLNSYYNTGTVIIVKQHWNYYELYQFNTTLLVIL